MIWWYVRMWTTHHFVILEPVIVNRAEQSKLLKVLPWVEDIVNDTLEVVPTEREREINKGTIAYNKELFTNILKF